MRWERFFFYLNRFNAIAIALVICGFVGLASWAWWQERRAEQQYEEEFGSGRAPEIPVFGDQIEVTDGLVAIYQKDGENDYREAGSGVTLVHTKNGKTVQVAGSSTDHVLQFELIYEEGEQPTRGFGWIATVATPEQYKRGRADLIVGALPAMTRNVVARDIAYLDLPTVRGNGEVGVLLWPDEKTANFAAIRLSDGAIVDRSTIALPWLDKPKLQQSPRTGDAIERGPPAAAPHNKFD